MYSPKIKKDLIPKLYRLGKRQRKPMTELVDDILREYIEKIEDGVSMDGEIESHFKKSLVRDYRANKD